MEYKHNIVQCDVCELKDHLESMTKINGKYICGTCLDNFKKIKDILNTMNIRGMNMQGIKSTVALFETKRHELSLSNFHLLAAHSISTRKKWDSFSKQTKENIYLYFQFTRGLLNEFDGNYSDFDYWKEWFIIFMNRFDESKPYYDGLFENVVLNNTALMKSLLNE